MTDLLVGTDRRTLLSASPSHRQAPRTRPVPAGLRHAVPRGTRVALCGESPPALWEDEPWPGRAHESDLCQVCRAVEHARRRPASQ